MTPVAATLTLDAAAGRRWDVVVVGGGPAGAATAHEVARRGGAVLLVERCVLPRAKVCGCCLSARAVAALARMGLGELPGRCGARPLHELLIAVPGRAARVALGGGAALSRERFDAELVRAAIGAGAAFLPETAAELGATGGDHRRVSLRGVAGTTVVVRAGVVVAAGGLGDRAALRAAEIAPIMAPGSHVGAGVVVDAAPAGFAAGVIHMAVGRGGYVGLVRLEDGRLDLAASLSPAAIREHGLGPTAAAIVRAGGLAEIPGLERLPWRGTPGLTRRPTRVAAERLLLVGDAAGYIEPFTGEGMACALASAAAVAPLAVRGGVDWSAGLQREWERLHRGIVVRRQGVCRVLAGVLRRRWCARLLVEALALAPQLARPVVWQLNRAGGRPVDEPGRGWWSPMFTAARETGG